ncbi:unnamed protein product [Rangifer tarandus platyrhynchus]|uniref:Uncharacterized protein n=2 Tax=Rangifer tarandus platyrhynchus TaxID=3082113 RepID=A0ABN8YK04_RANTA|nr:unnamed protein product [Rangifer tarandus platyrhynchus]
MGVCVSGCPVAQWCLIVCDPVDHSLRGSSVRGIILARILDSVAMPSFHTPFQDPSQLRAPSAQEAPPTLSSIDQESCAVCSFPGTLQISSSPPSKGQQGNPQNFYHSSDSTY